MKKYLDYETIWYSNGKKGILLSDPSKSGKTFLVEFNKKNCNIVKKLLEYNFNTMKKLVFKNK